MACEGSVGFVGTKPAASLGEAGQEGASIVGRSKALMARRALWLLASCSHKCVWGMLGARVACTVGCETAPDRINREESELVGVAGNGARA